MSRRFTFLLVSIASLLTLLAAPLVLSLSERDWAAPALATWNAEWSPYRIVDRESTERRLIKATITLPDGAHPTASIALCDSRGMVLDSEPIPPMQKKVWPHGFWIPVTASKDLPFSVRLQAAEKTLAERAVVVSGQSEALSTLPLRIDRLDRNLMERLARREQFAAAAETPNLEGYLRQHDIVYRRPSPKWDEGLALGNGDVGALITGSQGKEQVFYLDKTDLWFATDEGKPLGRSYAGVMRIRYGDKDRSGPFLQRLSLGRAQVETQDGAFRSTARIHALRNRLEVEIAASQIEIVLERNPLPLWDNRAARLYGAWAAFTKEADLETIRAEVNRAPHTHLEWGSASNECWFTHIAPNLKYSTVLSIQDAEVQWKASNGGYTGQVQARSGKPIRISASLATSREAGDSLAEARRMTTGDTQKSHLDWWHRFWNRSWIELPDKLEENLWYLGIYQQAICSRSDQAVSFFGLWHPVELRNWYDGYVTDAQVEMMWWQSFAANHLELLYPSHRTFGRLAVEFAKHTPGAGMVVPHLFTPEWAGGHQWFTGTNPYKGSVAWYTMNFWWDYVYSGDREFLKEVTYPLLRMVTDYFEADLVREADGRYHCVRSGSPEQSHTARDNVYDWGLLHYLFRATIRASEVLGVDSEARLKWQDILANLFPSPGDGKTLWETPDSPHPYRCHPVVFFGLYPTNAIGYGSSLFEMTRRTLPVATRVVGYRYEDRHETIPSFEGGVESNGFSSGILAITAARLGDIEQYRRFLYGLIVRFHLKQNGLRALLDTRQSSEISRASLVEAANVHTVATTETLVQSWDDHVRLFPCITARGRYRFSGLRAAGGFVLSAEANDGVLRWAQVKSLYDGKLKLALPGIRDVVVRESGTLTPLRFRWLDREQGDRRIELDCRAQTTYEILSKEGSIDLKLQIATSREEPRKVPLVEVEDYRDPLVHYPEDLPFGQMVKDGNLYLGRPAEYGSPQAAPEVRQLFAEASHTAWQQRQRAARLFVRAAPDERVLAVLDELCADPVNVVGHTAAVTLVRLGTPAALAIANKHAEKDSVPGLRREVEKAIRRYRVQ